MNNIPTLGDRMKSYEAEYKTTLTNKIPVFIRVDGRAFHTYTKPFDKPFDFRIIYAMLYSAHAVAAEMQGFTLGYVQSDEATFMLQDTAKPSSEPWFGNEVNKIVSLTASMFTAHFNDHMASAGLRSYGVATFDARAFNVPFEDAANVFVWRQRDWERNWIHMLARSKFSTKQLHKKSRRDADEMLREIGVNPDEQPDIIKHGTFVFPGGVEKHFRPNYIELTELVTFPEQVC